MTLADKLTYLGGTKDAIKTAIEGKGVSVPPETTFREYADKIASIEGGPVDTLGIYSIGLVKPTTGESARLGVNLMRLEDYPGGKDVFGLARRFMPPLPFVGGIQGGRRQTRLIGSSDPFSEEYSALVMLQDNAFWFSAPTSPLKSTYTEPVTVISDFAGVPNILTVKVPEITTTRVGPSSITISKWNESTGQWDELWIAPDIPEWASEEQRVFYRPGYTP